MNAWPKEITVVAGRPFEIKANVTGNPTPEFTWYDQKGLRVIQDDRMRLDKLPTAVNLRCVESKRVDAGRFTLKLTNENGSTEAVCTVNVLGEMI